MENISRVFSKSYFDDTRRLFNVQESTTPRGFVCILYGMKNGVILESGAFDGYKLSSTYMLEKFAEWNSIHVEADPINYTQLAINRPDSINVHMALCDTPRTLHYVDTGITLAHSIAEFMPEKFLRMHHPYLYRNRTRIGNLREVPCFPVQYLLRYLKRYGPVYMGAGHRRC